MPRPDRALEAEVIRRAQGRCEYCHFPRSAAELPFHIDHIIAEKHGGPTAAENLAWACFSCNLRKGPNIAGLDPETGEQRGCSIRDKTTGWNTLNGPVSLCTGKARWDELRSLSLR